MDVFLYFSSFITSQTTFKNYGTGINYLQKKSITFILQLPVIRIMVEFRRKTTKSNNTGAKQESEPEPNEGEKKKKWNRGRKKIILAPQHCNKLNKVGQ